VALPRPPDRGRPALIVGATTLSVGGVLLGAMTYALFMRRASDDGIKAIGAAVMMQPDALPTPEQRALADSLAYVGRYHRTTAIATGIAGGALVLSGVTALIVRRARRGKVSKLAL
jgi:nitrate reductase gamma subunit